MMGSRSFPRRPAALVLVLAAVTLMWASYSLVMPFMITHHPQAGPWAFAEFLVWQTVPAAVGLTVFLLLRLAVRFWYPAYGKALGAGLAGALCFALFLGAIILSIALHYGN